MTTANFKALLQLAHLNLSGMTPEARIDVASALASAAQQGANVERRRVFAFWAECYREEVERVNAREAAERSR